MKMHFLRDIKHHASGLRHISKLLMIRRDLAGGQIIPDLPTGSFLCFCVKQKVQITVRVTSLTVGQYSIPIALVNYMPDTEAVPRIHTYTFFFIIESSQKL